MTNDNEKRIAAGLTKVTLQLGLVLALMTACLPAWAQNFPLTFIDPAAAVQVLDGCMAVLDDPDGTMTPDHVLAEPPGRFRYPGPLDKGGFTQVTEWRALSLRNPTAAAQTRLLVIERRNLNFIDLYVTDGQGGFYHEQAGNLRPFPVQAYPDSNFTFKITIPSGQTVDLLLRVNTSGAMVVSAAMWQPDAYYHVSAHDILVQGLLHGSALLVVLLTLAGALATRERVVIWFLLHISAVEVALLFFSGILHQWLFPNTPVLAVILLYLGVGGGLGAGFMFVVSVLDLSHSRTRTAWLFRGLALVSALLTVIGLAGYYAAVSPAVNVMVLSFVLLSMLVIWAEVWRGQRHLALMGLGFGVVALSMTLRISQNFGLPIPSTIAAWSMQVGFSGYAIILMVAVIGHFKRTQDLGLSMTRQLLAVTEQREQLLDEMVRDRTMELEASQTRLRASLETERNIVAEQRNFLSMVSHEFKTPMSIVLAAASNISAAPLTEEETEEEVDSIISAIRRMEMLVEKCLTDDWLDHGARAIRRHQLDLVDLIGATVDAHRAAFPGRVIDWTPPPEPIAVNGDGMLLGVMVSNILENAMKYSPAAAPVVVTASVVDGLACLRIADGGSGIAAEERGRIFEKFYRSPKVQRRPGAGLGLYIVRKIALLHGGDVTLENSAFPGTTFVIRVPTTQ